MLSLDDSRWHDLHHAYGAAADIPDLLRLLPGAGAAGGDEPWLSLWSSLCHQGDVHTASYAAVPHIVDIACRTAGPIRFDFFLLPAAIEVARRSGHGPDVPHADAADYHAAIARLTDAVSLHRHESWDRSMLLSALAAQAIAKGDVAVAEALLNIDEDWIARINGDAAD